MHIGIDLGTTNSLIAVFRNGKPELIPNALGSVLTPSVVAYHNGAIVVGETAKEILSVAPENAVAMFKRGMGTERSWKLGRSTFNASELSAMVLSALKEDAQTHLGQQITDVVISVPAYFNELQRKAVRAAGKIAGLNVTRLINEPTAAALAYGLHEGENESRMLVFDLGGGTFDVSIVEFYDGVMEVKASAGDAFLGGEDFTDSLMRYIASQCAIDANVAQHRAQLLRLAETAKRQLAREPLAKITASINGQDINLEISRERFDEITAAPLTRMSIPLDRAMNDAKLAPEDIDKLVLVGGATRMQSVRSFATKRLRQLPIAGLDPDHVVALGAAVQAALVANDAALDDVVMTDVSAFTLGVATSRKIGRDYHAGYYAPIIERNSIVPISREQIMTALQPGQSHIVLRVFQGEAPLVVNNLFLGEINVPIPINNTACESVAVRFTYDVSGLLEVDATVLSTQVKSNLVIDKLAGEMSKADIKSALAKMAALKTHPRNDAEIAFLHARIEAAYAMAKSDAREWLGDLLVQLDAAIERQNPTELAQLSKDLHQAIDEFEASYVR
jgi:molecular chaperone HscC